MIRPVRGRAAFERLRRGRRARVGGLGITFEPAPPEQPDDLRVAFAIGRSVGGAVTRNRLRRRLRHLLAGLSPTDLPAGTYLFRTDPSLARLTYQELCQTVMRALERLRAER